MVLTDQVLAKGVEKKLAADLSDAFKNDPKGFVREIASFLQVSKSMNDRILSLPETTPTQEVLKLVAIEKELLKNFIIVVKLKAAKKTDSSTVS